MDKEIEEQRRESLQRHKEGRPHWRESLASVSEAGVRLSHITRVNNVSAHIDCD